MILAILETGNFTFHVVTHTRDEALTLLAGAWDRHAFETGAWMTWDELEESVNIHYIERDQVLRDGEPI